jgi:4-amino-4-deoxy-L-arabinose transferase-like glycosyltransferase
MPETRLRQANSVLRHPALILGALTLVLHAYVNQRYGVFRDELYFIVCGRHPDWGYVDQPPLIPLIAALADHLAPGSLLLLRAVSALAMAATAAATVYLARLLDGRLFAQWLAGLCVLLAPVDLAFGALLTTDAFLPLAWVGCAALVILMLRSGDYRLWLFVGIAVGLTLWSKYLILYYVAALAIVLP